MVGTLGDKMDSDCGETTSGCGLLFFIILPLTALVLTPLAVPIALLIIVTETLDTAQAGMCDYGLLQTWSYITAVVLIVDFITMMRYWSNTKATVERSEDWNSYYSKNKLGGAVEKLQKQTFAPDTNINGNSLRQTTVGLRTYPVPDNLSCLPIDRCVLYQEGERPSANDLDCASTSNCLFFFVVPVLKIGLYVWGHIMLSGELIPMPYNHTATSLNPTATMVTRSECFISDGPLPLQFFSICIATLVFGWIVSVSQIAGCISPLLISDSATGLNEFERSKERRKLYYMSIAAIEQNEHNDRNIEELRNNPPTTSTMTRGVDVESGITPTLGNYPTGMYMPKSDWTPKATTTTTDTRRPMLTAQNITTGEETSDTLPIANVESITIQEEEKEEKKEEAYNANNEPFLTDNAMYVARGVGNGALFVGRGMFSIAAWGAKRIFATDGDIQEEKNEKESKDTV